MQAPDYREQVVLHDGELESFNELTGQLEYQEEHFPDPSLLTRIYSS